MRSEDSKKKSSVFWQNLVTPYYTLNMDYESNPCFHCNKHVYGHQNNMQGLN